MPIAAATRRIVTAANPVGIGDGDRRLYLRALDYRSDDPILEDAVSALLVETIDYDFAPIRGGKIMTAVHATRTKVLDDTVRGFVRLHPDAVVLDLGSGLDPRAHRCDPPPGVDCFDVDLPEVIRLRERFLPGGSTLISADLARPDPNAVGEVAADWLRAVPADRPAMIVCDGLMIPLPGFAFRALARAPDVVGYRFPPHRGSRRPLPLLSPAPHGPRVGPDGRAGRSGKLEVMLRQFVLVVPLVAFLVGGCSAGGSNTSCGVDGCTITFPRSGDTSVSVLGVEARLVGVQHGTAELAVAGQTVTVPVGGETQAGGFTVGVEQVTDQKVVVRVRP